MSGIFANLGGECFLSLDNREFSWWNYWIFFPGRNKLLVNESRSPSRGLKMLRCSSHHSTKPLPPSVIVGGVPQRTWLRELCESKLPLPWRPSEIQRRCFRGWGATRTRGQTSGELREWEIEISGVPWSEQKWGLSWNNEIARRPNLPDSSLIDGYICQLTLVHIQTCAFWRHHAKLFQPTPPPPNWCSICENLTWNIRAITGQKRFFFRMLRIGHQIDQNNMNTPLFWRNDIRKVEMSSNTTFAVKLKLPGEIHLKWSRFPHEFFHFST